ncbi:MAG: LysR family transcriptional regulator [Gemmobacter sp.]|nr:LysR family transcriptional regulator [Gemmobacter sp.]
MYASIDPTIDVRLLRTTCLLLRERSVSRVAHQLGHSQPAVSASLKRARTVFGDPLLVRSGQTLVLTDRGTEVLLAIEGVLQNLQGMLTSTESFDPSGSTQRIRIGAVNCFGAFLIPAIGANLRREAPHATVDFFAPHEFGQLAQDMAAGAVDLVIGNWPSPQESLRSSTLLNCEIACLVHHRHPLANQDSISIDDYLRLDHVSPTPVANALYSPIDGRLGQLGLRRRVAMTVPEYGLIPALLRETDLIFTSARSYVEHIADSAGHEDLCVIAAPREFTQMSLYLLWHERVQTSLSNQWLRGLVRRVAKRFDQSLHGQATGPSDRDIVHFLSA